LQCWADEPPVERANSDVPDKTLDMARDDAMQRTETTLVSETPLSQQGFPARDFSARNLGEGFQRKADPGAEAALHADGDVSFGGCAEGAGRDPVL